MRISEIVEMDIDIASLLYPMSPTLFEASPRSGTQKLTLAALSQLKRFRAFKSLELLKRQNFLATMYSQGDDEAEKEMLELERRRLDVALKKMKLEKEQYE